MEQKNSLIHIQPFDPKTSSVIENITWSKTGGDSIIVTIVDKDNINISKDILVAQGLQNGRRFTLGFDSSCNCRSDLKRDSKIIMISTLQKLFRQKLEFPLKDSNNAVIQLSISRSSFYNMVGDWEYYESFELLQTGDELTTLHPDLVDDGGKLVQRKYKRYQ